MSWSLQTISGDLNLSGPQGYSTVSGPQKLLQDLRNWLLEKRGTDPLHPSYGSVLDGGITRGIRMDSFIGSTITRETLMNIEIEIRRVLAEYQELQSARLQKDLTSYGGRHTFGVGELLTSVGNVAVRQIADVVVVRVQLITSSGQSISLIQPVTRA